MSHLISQCRKPQIIRAAIEGYLGSLTAAPSGPPPWTATPASCLPQAELALSPWSNRERARRRESHPFQLPSPSRGWENLGHSSHVPKQTTLHLIRPPNSTHGEQSLSLEQTHPRPTIFLINSKATPKLSTPLP